MGRSTRIKNTYDVIVPEKPTPFSRMYHLQKCIKERIDNNLPPDGELKKSSAKGGQDK